MKVNKRLALGAAAVAAIGVAVPSFAAPSNPQGGTGGPKFCTDQMGRTMDGAITWTPSNLWPANHKMVPVTISYTEPAGDSDGDTTMITVDSVQEQDGTSTPQDATTAETFNGSGKPGQIDASADGAPTAGSDTTPATVVEDLRAERSGTDGHGSGRTYLITVRCTEQGSPENLTVDPNDLATSIDTQTGTAVIEITVPHDQGN